MNIEMSNKFSEFKYYCEYNKTNELEAFYSSGPYDETSTVLIWASFK